MTTMTYTVRDSATMLRRNLLHMRRYPSMTLMLAGMPLYLNFCTDSLYTGNPAGHMTMNPGRF